MADLKTLRLRRFLTQVELAKLAGVPYQSVQRWESGESMPRPDRMRRLAEALEISGEELLEAIEETRKKEAA